MSRKEREAIYMTGRSSPFPSRCTRNINGSCNSYFFAAVERKREREEKDIVKIFPTRPRSIPRSSRDRRRVGWKKTREIEREQTMNSGSRGQSFSVWIFSTPCSSRLFFFSFTLPLLSPSRKSLRSLASLSLSLLSLPPSSLSPRFISFSSVAEKRFRRHTADFIRFDAVIIMKNIHIARFAGDTDPVGSGEARGLKHEPSSE